MVLLSLSSRLEAFAQLLTLLVVFVFVIALTYFSTKWVGGIQKERLSGSNIKILETMRISNSKYIQLVQIADKTFAIAVAKDSITYLCEVNKDDLLYSESSDSKISSEGFKAIMEKFKKDKPDN